MTAVSAGAPRRTENEAALASTAAGYWGAAGGRVGSPRRRGLEACRRAGAEGREAVCPRVTRRAALPAAASTATPWGGAVYFLEAAGRVLGSRPEQPINNGLQKVLFLFSVAPPAPRPPQAVSLAAEINGALVPAASRAG